MNESRQSSIHYHKIAGAYYPYEHSTEGGKKIQHYRADLPKLDQVGYEAWQAAKQIERGERQAEAAHVRAEKESAVAIADEARRAALEEKRQARLEAARAEREWAQAKAKQAKAARLEADRLAAEARQLKKQIAREENEFELWPQFYEWRDQLTINMSPATTAGYVLDVKAFARAVSRSAPGDYKLPDLSGYLADRRRAGISASALKRCVAALRSFFGYACPGANVAKGLPFPKVKRKRQRTLDESELMAVLASCDTSSELGARDLAIISLMADSGLRSAEVCRLKVSDLDFQKRRLWVVIKGGDEKPGSFSADTAAALSRWLEVRAQRVRPGVATLFVGLGGLTPGRPLTTSGLRVIFRAIAKRAGLVGQFSPHVMRRTMCCLALRRGAPTRIVMSAGRWSTLTMVEVYSQAITIDDFDNYSPMAGLLGAGCPRT